MKRKHLSLAVAALLAAGGLWFARSAWRTHTFHKSSMGVGVKNVEGQYDVDELNASGQLDREVRRVDDIEPPKPGHKLRPPNPSRLFTDFTPEQRVQFARKGHGPGG